MVVKVGVVEAIQDEVELEKYATPSLQANAANSFGKS